MKVNVWNYGETFDLAAFMNIDCINMICFKISNYEEQISKSKCTIGDFLFEPDAVYSQIGYQHKTSSGYVCYIGEPLVFVGIFEEYLLFSKTDKTVENSNGYYAIYYALKKLSENSLFTLNAATSGRIIEMKTQPVPGGSGE